MSASQRRKGARFERDICNDLKEAGYEAKRNLEQVRTPSGRDITMDDGTPICFQLKTGADPRWKQALREAMDSAGSDYAVAVTHEDASWTVAHIPWPDFIELLSLPDVRRALKGER